MSKEEILKKYHITNATKNHAYVYTYNSTLKAMDEYADKCLNDYLNAILCIKSIPMPKADSNSIAESINKYLNK